MAKRRKRTARISGTFLLQNRLGRMRLWPSARFVTRPAYKTYDAALAFAATLTRAAVPHLSMAVARTLAPRTLAEALSGLRSEWRYLSSASPTIVLNRLIAMGRDVRSAVILQIAPVSRAFNGLSHWTGQLSGRVSGLFARVGGNHGLRRLRPAQTLGQTVAQPAPETPAATRPARAMAPAA